MAQNPAREGLMNWIKENISKLAIGLVVTLVVSGGGFLGFLQVQKYLRTQQEKELVYQSQLQASLIGIESLKKEAGQTQEEIKSLGQESEQQIQEAQMKTRELQQQLLQESQKSQQVIKQVEQKTQEEIYKSQQQAQQYAQNITQQYESQRLQDQLIAQQKISELQQQISQIPTEPDLSTIISQWKPYIASLRCEFLYDTGELAATSYGSGTLIVTSSDAVILTNRHVVFYQDSYLPSVCYSFLPDLGYSFSHMSQDFRVSPDSNDWAGAFISNPTPSLLSLANSSLPHCTITPNIGDKVVILGYPSIGAQGTVTATEGIISGYEGNYLITSAKIEQGNSGGAAILVKNNCLLGIPTFARVGDVESLARILFLNAIF